MSRIIVVLLVTLAAALGALVFALGIDVGVSRRAAAAIEPIPAAKPVSRTAPAPREPDEDMEAVCDQKLIEFLQCHAIVVHNYQLDQASASDSQ